MKRQIVSRTKNAAKRGLPEASHSRSTGQFSSALTLIQELGPRQMAMGILDSTGPRPTRR